MKSTPNNSSDLNQYEPTNYQLIVELLGFDRLGLTNDVPNAVQLDGRTWLYGMRFESDGVRSEGHVRLRIDRAETIDVLLTRLKAISGLVRVTQTFSSKI